MVEDVVLLIDPDELERKRLQRAFAREGFRLLEAESAIEGLFETLERDPVLILLAEQVPPLEAGELLLVLRRITEAPVIVIGSGEEPEEGAALELGADFYLRRPFGDKIALARARALIRRHRGTLHRERLSARRNDLRLVVSGRPMLLNGDAGRRAAS
jgi:two-component system response regulator ChvI